MNAPTDRPLPARDQWESLVGERFGLADEAIELSLTEVDGRSDREFALQFLGPTEPRLHQGMRRLESESTGPLDVFLVPIGADDDHCRYEAVFNLLPPSRPGS